MVGGEGGGANGGCRVAKLRLSVDLGREVSHSVTGLIVGGAQGIYLGRGNAPSLMKRIVCFYSLFLKTAVAVGGAYIINAVCAHARSRASTCIYKCSRAHVLV